MVDAEVFADSDVPWAITESPLSSHGTFGPNVVETEYRHAPTSNEVDTPGLLLLIGIRTLNQIATEDLLERTREILDQSLADEGVQVDDVETRGTRETVQGSPTQWFTLTGHASNNAPLFAGDEEVRVLGEAWYDGRSKTHVVAIALAQTTTSGLLGAEQRDHTVWDKLVGDKAGTIGGSVDQGGFIIHVNSHN